MKTNELTGAAMDWAVAKCEGKDPVILYNGLYLAGVWWNPSIDWSQGGPIIEREKIEITYNTESDVIEGEEFDWMVGQWDASPRLSDKDFRQWGATPLIAAMRCYVASKLGDEVEIPEELL